jgi:hypothetical protein
LLYPLSLILFSAWFCPSLWLGLWCLVNKQPVGNPKRKVWWI